MLKTIFGLLLLLIPFLLIYNFKDKKVGFAYILSFLILFHLLDAIVLQAFHVFNYYSVLAVVSISDMIVLINIKSGKIFEHTRKIKVDWIMLLVILIIFIELFAVHNDYTGKITTATTSYSEVSNMKYPYPYFSDEWISVAFIKYTISSQSLPLVNPLWYDNPFPNLQLPFHSTISEILVLLGLDPLTQYSLLHVFTGMILCMLIYLILRINNIENYIAGVAAVGSTYIVNGANLPGIWTLIPIIIGVICLFLGFFFLSIKDNKMIMLSMFLAMIFYPPLIVFSIASFVFYFFMVLKEKDRLKQTMIYAGICAAMILVMLLFTYLVFNSSHDMFSYILSKIFYSTFTQNAIPNFAIWKVIPWPILIFAAIGLIHFKKKIWLIAPIVVGLAYWIFYSISLWRFVIDYERVIFATSFMIALLSGFGLGYAADYLNKISILKKKNVFRRYNIIKILFILVLVLFYIFAFFYTRIDAWKDLKLYSLDGQIFSPASPANAYLSNSDLRLFNNITAKKFLSIPWKGTVIGIATDNYALETKSSTITNSVVKYSEFMSETCDDKLLIAKKFGIDYIYSVKFSCKGFDEIGSSPEGFYLYKVIG